MILYFFSLFEQKIKLLICANQNGVEPARVWFFRDRTPLREFKVSRGIPDWTVFSQIESIDGRSKFF